MTLMQQGWGEELCVAALKCWGCPALCQGKKMLELALSVRDEPQADAHGGQVRWALLLFCCFCELLLADTLSCGV